MVKEIKPASKKDIKDFYCHGTGNRRVKITKIGQVKIFGTPNYVCEKSDPWWHVGMWQTVGWAWDYLIADGKVKHYKNK